MPSKTLPPELKNITMMEVLLTHHTEEDVWTFYVKKCEELFEFESIIHNARERWISKVFEKNPYTNHNWRKGKPSRLQKDGWLKYLNEAEVQKYHELAYLPRDLHVCNRALKWEEKEDFHQLVFDVEKTYKLFSDDGEFQLYEANRFREAKEKWETDDAVWIQEQKDLNYHKSSHRPKGWKENWWNNIGEEEKAWYSRGPVDFEFHEDCRFCKMEEEQRIKKEKEEREYQERQEQQEREYHETWKRECEEKRKVEEEQRVRNTVKYTCECCKFDTTSKYVFDEHNQSRSHKAIKNLQDWYCADCETQCRTSIEWAAHINSRKHKIQIGEVEKTEDYHCEKCGYTTKHKQNFDKHCITKRHIELHKV